MQCESCAIKNLIYRYADLIDSGDLDAVAALFAHGRILATGGDGQDSEVIGAEAVNAMYRSFTRIYEDNGTPHTRHVTTNVMVDVDEDGQLASARSSAVVFQALNDFPLQPVIAVRYQDRFEKANGEWRFVERRILSDLFGDLSRHLLRPV
jgi:3-phenylpropionate/cinnamic acid dioxygenase small subunit